MVTEETIGLHFTLNGTLIYFLWEPRRQGTKETSVASGLAAHAIAWEDHAEHACLLEKTDWFFRKIVWFSRKIIQFSKKMSVF
jgi:hypothetical protein